MIRAWGQICSEILKIKNKTTISNSLDFFIANNKDGYKDVAGVFFDFDLVDHNILL